MVKKTISKLKKELDKWFSLYIRLRYATSEGLVQCFTCGKVGHYKKLQCGHFQTRRHHSTRWNEQNCQVQCVKCNMFEQGQQYIFGNKLKAEIGEDKFNKLIQLSNTSVKRSKQDYEDMIAYYKKELEILCK